MKFINSFEDLIIESNISLLLEGQLIASEEFLRRLGTITDNKIAKFLFNKFSSEEEVEKDLPQNIVDVTDKDDTITFMSDKSFKKLTLDVDDTEIFKVKGRSETRVGRFAKALSSELGEKFADKEIEEFVNLYKASKESKTEKFELVSGSDIAKYYNEKSYSGVTGTLGGSCMKYGECQDYFELYVNNPSICRMLIYLDGKGKLLGRALVWKVHKLEMTEGKCDAEYFMDRIYTAKDSDIIKFSNYAIANNWIQRKKMSNDPQDGGTLVFVHNKKTYIGKIVIKLSKSADYNEYPYVDTLKFCNGDKLISNVGFVTKSGDQFIMDDTDGHKDSCHDCDNTGIDADDDCKNCGGNGEVKCQDCMCKDCDEGWVKCSKCEGEGDIKCPDCDEDGNVECTKCKEGSLGKCKVCNGQPFDCKKCDGKGKYTRKWGIGKRTMSCEECGGDGKIHPNPQDGWSRGTQLKVTSINKCECAVKFKVSYYSTEIKYENLGHIRCDECNGDGQKSCPKCDGNVYLSCPVCKRSQGKNCKNCKGTGHLPKCKNKKCQSDDYHTARVRMVECPDCKGSGESNGKENKCPSCAGFLEDFLQDLKNGNAKV